MKPLISIIVPVYNSEKFLEDCLNSIIRQTYLNLEIIIVDDGSTDRSVNICDEYARRDNRIIVIHKANGGNISARKAGARIAKGEYIGFVDSDDWIEPIMFEKLMEETKEGTIDMVSSGHYIEETNARVAINCAISSGLYSSQEDMKYIRRNMIFERIKNEQGITYTLCSKLFRRSILDEVIYKIDDECNYVEDAACVFLFIQRCTSVSIVYDIYYHYRMNMESMIHSKNEKYLICINKIYILLKNEFKKAEDNQILMEKLDTFIIIQILKGINHYMGFSSEMSIPYYHFPSHHLTNGASIILYGAGRVGKSYYKQMQSEKNFKIVRWVDQKYDIYTENGLAVDPVDSIFDADFDYIIIASVYKVVAASIKEELIKKGISENKIIWYEPVLGI